MRCAQLLDSMEKKKVKCGAAILLGFVRVGGKPVCGETMKNQQLLSRLESLGVKCYVADFFGWRKHPWTFLYLMWLMVAHRSATLIFSTSPGNSYPLMRLLKMVKWRQPTVHWVIGGTFADNVEKGVFRADVVGRMGWTIVESEKMKRQLEKAGLHNVLFLPNFKCLPKLPIKQKHTEKLRLVFVSRIIPDKGCDYIIDSAQRLNAMGLGNRYCIDFYGKIDESYQTTFERRVKECDTVEYRGYLNLMEQAGYDHLASYDAMLFPTYWKGEGFAGIFIDAFCAGLPIIASRWAHNEEFIRDGETGILIPPHDVDALTQAIKDCICGQYPLDEMAVVCQRKAQKYDVDEVVNAELLSMIGLINQ